MCSFQVKQQESTYFFCVPYLPYLQYFPLENPSLQESPYVIDKLKS